MTKGDASPPPSPHPAVWMILFHSQAGQMVEATMAGWPDVTTAVGARSRGSMVVDGGAAAVAFSLSHSPPK